MPRYYRRRATRVVRPKKKWATNLVDVTTNAVINANTVLFAKQLAVNASPTSNPTPVIVKTGNFKLQCDVSFTINSGAQMQVVAYVVYVPEGMSTQVLGYTNAKDFITKHPEWILCWKYGSNDFLTPVTGGGANVDSIKVSSRLKRNLNSGDSIYLLCLAETTSSVTVTAALLGGMCQYWTCAN